MVTEHLKVHEARRVHDPNFPAAVEHLFTVNVLDLPKIPLGANPREQNTNKRIYREVRDSLLNDAGNDNAFLGKNLGIYACAEDVKKSAEDRYTLVFNEGDSVLDGSDGILNGGHTAKIIWSAQERLREKAQEGLNVNQFVKLYVRVGYPRDVLAEMAGTLNTALQVQDYSLAEHQDKFGWLHDVLDGQPFGDKIAYKENVTAPVYVTDVLSMLDLFNVTEYPNDGGKHPTGAYHQKSNVLKRYLAEHGDEPFKRLSSITPDILKLHDIIAREGREKYNQYFPAAGQKRGAGGNLEWIDKRDRGEFEFPFLSEGGQYRVNRAAVYPVLAAFRWMIEDNGGGSVTWKGGFSAVRRMWDTAGPEMMKMTQDTSVEVNRKTQHIGKSPTHYNALHSLVAKRQLILDLAAA